MRAPAAAAAAAFTLLAACAGGDAPGTGRPVAGPTSTIPPTRSAPSPTSMSAPTTTVPTASNADPPGSVTFRARQFFLPANGGVRVLVAAASSQVTVRRTGVGGALSVCSIADAITPAGPGACSELGAERVVDLGRQSGVEIRAGDAGARIEEVTLSYFPSTRSTTVVLPARGFGSCTAACEATFSLGPPRAGPFTLVSRGSGSRPRLVARADGGSAGPSRVLATVEGGGPLSINAVLESAVEAVVLYREQLDGVVGALAMEISWP